MNFNDEYIRPPDEQRTMRLNDFNNINNNTNNNISITDSDLAKVLKESQEEYELMQYIQQIEQIEEMERIEAIRKEKELLLLKEKEKQEELNNEINKRTKEFSSLKVKFNKLVSFDATNKSIYELILNAIELYITCDIDNYSVEEEEYINIMNVCKNIRKTTEENIYLQNLFIKT